MDNEIKTIYHYTNLRSFIGMLTNRELWLTNISGMNDKNEYFELIEKIGTALSEKCPHKERVGEFVYYSKRHLDYVPCCAMCFSELRDDAAMWERYGDNARGVCIGFNFEELKKQLINGYFLDSVRYEQDDDFYATVDYIEKKINTLEENNWFYSVRDTIQNFICRKAIIYKNKSFQSEREIRLYSGKVFSELEKSDFYEHHGIIKVINKLPFSPNAVINEVIIGPKSMQNIAVLKNYLEQIGDCGNWGEKIHLSNCSLR